MIVQIQDLCCNLNYMRREYDVSLRTSAIRFVG